jgi:hypothetical protein
MTDDLVEWCDEYLPELYNPGLFDDEETTDDVWETVQKEAEQSILAHIDDEVERERVSDALMDIAAEWFRTHRDTEIENLPSCTAEQIDTLLNKPQTSQHSADWYAERRNRLTASEFSNILTGSRGRLLQSKLDTSTSQTVNSAPVALAQRDGNMNATSWGHRFEPVVRDIYELEIAGVGTVCSTLGRFTHAVYPWLSASPDGIVIKGPLVGRLLEIKAPKTRQPDTYVPREYYVQMQVQMEVCDIDAVDFVEAQFGQEEEGDTTPAYVAEAHWKGRIHVYGYTDDPTTWTYRYSAPVEDMKDAIVEPAPDLPLLESSIWWLKGWYPRTVLRNRSWWETVGWPEAELFWTQVVSARESNTNTDTKTVWLGS